MYYPGDIVPVVLSLQRPDGSSQTVTSSPTVSIMKPDGSVIETDEDMSETYAKTYSFLWDTSGQDDGPFLVFVSYTADSVVVQNKFHDVITLGDSRVTDVVAKDATVAKDSTVAKHATVLKTADYVAPDASTLVQQIKAALDALPVNIASESTLDSVLLKVADILDAVAGSLIIDKNENTMTMLKADESPLRVFALENTDAHSSRIRVS